MREQVYKAELKQLQTEVSTTKLTMCRASGMPRRVSVTV